MICPNRNLKRLWCTFQKLLERAQVFLSGICQKESSVKLSDDFVQIDNLDLERAQVFLSGVSAQR
jgi:hypothetical protein